MFIVATVVTYLADLVIEHQYASVITMRKVCNSIGKSIGKKNRKLNSLFFLCLAQYGTGMALLATAFAGCDRLLSVLSLNVSLGLLGTAFGGFLVNSIDIAPNHTGVIMVTLQVKLNLRRTQFFIHVLPVGLGKLSL